MISYSSTKENIFCLFSVINEENGRSGTGPWTFRLWIIIYVIDALQVLRILLSSRYGWSWAVVNVAKSLNIIELIISLGSTIPRVVFYAFGQILVAAAIADALYIINNYRQGTLKHQWPVKFLTVMLSVLLWTFYPSFLGWILYPADCALAPEDYFSTMLHGGVTSCAPWGVPEFGLTLLSIVVVIIFILSSLVSSFLCFEVNPLCQSVRAACTGRVELLWTVLRGVCVMLGLLTFYFPPAICATIVFVLACFLIQYHLSVMPFHNLTENIVRGGVYTSVAWAALVSILISAVADPASPPSDAVFALEWVCVAIVPAVFCCGMTFVYMRHKGLIAKVNLLRRDWEISPEYKARADRRRRRSAASTQDSTALNETNNYAKNSIFDRFFDLEFEATRAFDSGTHAHLLARVILLERKKTDIPFLSYVLKRGLQEFPESRDLIILNLLLMRIFVRAQATHQTSAHERLIEALSDRTFLDHDYILFASQRGSGQPDGKGSITKDDVNAFQMHEFEMKFDKVQKYHHECVLALKTFWQMFYKHKKIFRSKKKYSEHLAEKVDELLACLEIIETCKDAAFEGYRALLDKFPRSVSLLRSYAGFCDVVLNRAAEANQYRDQALLLETSDESESSVGEREGSIGDDDGGGGGGIAKSTASSSEGTGRAKMDRFFSSWRESVMGRELSDLRKLHWRIFYATLLISIVCTIGFALTDSMLYEQSAHACINLVVGSQVFRVQLMDALFSIRSLFLAGSLEPSSVQKYQKRLDGIARDFASAHVQNFQAAPGAVVSFYNIPKWKISVPTGSGWTTVPSSLWSLGNELASQIGLASGVKVGEVKNWTNSLDGISPGLRAIAYLNENSIPHVVPAFEELGRAYIDQVVAFASLTHGMIWINVSLNVVLILLVAAHVLRSLDGVVESVQHERVIMLMVLYSSRACTMKIFNFYDAADKALTELEEGGLMNVDPDENPHSPRDMGGSQSHQSHEQSDRDGSDDERRRRSSGAWDDGGEFCDATGEGDDYEGGHSDNQLEDEDERSSRRRRSSEDRRDASRERLDPRDAARQLMVGAGSFRGRRRSAGEDDIRGTAGRSSPKERRLRRTGSPDSDRAGGGASAADQTRENTQAAGDVANTSLEGGSHDAVVRAQALARMKSAPQTMRTLEALVVQRRPWYAQRVVHLVTLVIMLVICIVSILFPSRNIDTMVNIPAKRNQAGRRRFLHRACVHFARELALGDGLSRLNSSEIAAALRWSLDELKAADNAVRLGGSKGVSAGSDRGLGSVDHNSYVYSTGCPWRDNYTIGENCTVPSRPQMLVHGLYGLLLAFYDACEAVLAKNLPEEWGDFLRTPQNCSVMGPVKLDADKAASLSVDMDLAFILESFDGDLFQALATVEDVLEVEQNVIFQLVHFEGRLLYGIFIGLVVVLFYFVVFRNTVIGSKTEIKRTLRFLDQMPVFVLDVQDGEVLRTFFQEREYDVKDHQQMMAEAAAQAATAAALGQLL